MSDHIDKTIATLEEKLEEISKDGIKIKQTINQLLELDGRDPRYHDDELQVNKGKTLKFRHDEFFNKPLATCVRSILNQRESLNQGAASLDDIFEALMSGSYDPDNKNESIAKRNVAIALSKNPIFVRLPNDTWGMRDWYGLKQSKKSSADNGTADNQEQESGELANTVDNPADNQREQEGNL